MVGPSRPQFVFFGSSIVQFSYSHEGWSAILADLYARKADVVLRGYAGWNSRCGVEVLDQVFPKDAAVQPSLVIVYFGGNDAMEPQPDGMSPHVPLPEYVENMRKIAVHLKSLSKKTRIIFLSTPPVNEAQMTEVYGNDQGRFNETMGKYSNACIELGKELGVKVIDLWTAVQQRDDWLTASFTDGIHFSAEGSKIVVTEILKVLKEAEWKPNLHWRSLDPEFARVSPFLNDPNGEFAMKISQTVFEWQTVWN